MSADILSDTKRFRLHSAELEKSAGLRQYLPYGVVFGTVAFLLYLRSVLL